MSRSLFLTSILALGLLSAAPATAQVSASQAASIDDLVVVARRTDAPIWEVTRGDSTLILVGSIEGVPRNIDWRPQALEEATRRADRILMPQYTRSSPLEVMRLMWRLNRVTDLPAGRTIAEYLPAADHRRLAALMAQDRSDRWQTMTPFVLGLNLMQNRAGLVDEDEARSAADVVRAAARRMRKPAQAVGVFSGKRSIDNLLNLPPETHVPCLQSAIAAVEAGPQAANMRIADWRSRRVPEVMAQPLNQALDRCWPWGDRDVAPALRQQWSEASQRALGQKGETLGVALLTVLAEDGGVLDQLEAAGYEIEGPIWKKGQALAPTSESETADPIG